MTANDNSTNQPIMVNPTPGPAQIEAGLRDAIKILGSIATMVGLAKWGGELNGLLVIVGPAATIIAFAWSQMKTRTAATNQATMAAIVPNAVAILKQ